MTEANYERGGGCLPFSRVLVTGSDGFVGKHLVPALWQVLPPGALLWTTVRHVADNGTTVWFDLTEPASIQAAIKRTRPDLVVHLAAQSSVIQSAQGAADSWSVNLIGSMALAKAVATFVPTATMLFASSVEVYGTTFNDEIATEDSALRPNSPYARSKAAAEAMFADVLPRTCRLIIARASNHSGAGQSDTFVIPAFAEQIVAAECGKLDEIHVGQLDSCRDFLAVEDVIDAYEVLLKCSTSLPMRAVFNIASGDCRRIGDILDALLSLANRRPQVRQDPAKVRPSEVPVARVSNAALAALGWKPRVAFDTMLARVLNERRDGASAAM